MELFSRNLLFKGENGQGEGIVKGSLAGRGPQLGNEEDAET